MAKLVVEASREDVLGRVERVVRRAAELRASFEAIARALRSRHSSDPRLRELVENLLKTYTPPPPPDPRRMLEVSSSIEEYVERFERIVEALASHAVALERLSMEIGKLEDIIGELEEWGEMLKDLAPHMSSEAFKLLSKARKIVEQLPLEDPSRSIDEIALTVKEARRVIRVCRGIYEGRVKELLTRASWMLKVLKKACRVASLSEIGEIKRYERRLASISEELEACLKAPLEYRVGIAAVRMELGEMEKRISELFRGVLGEDEEIVVEELERVSKALGGRTLDYSGLVETISRSTGIPLERAAYLIYLVSKKGFIAVKVKLS